MAFIRIQKIKMYLTKSRKKKIFSPPHLPVAHTG